MSANVKYQNEWDRRISLKFSAGKSLCTWEAAKIHPSGLRGRPSDLTFSVTLKLTKDRDNLPEEVACEWHADEWALGPFRQTAGGIPGRDMGMMVYWSYSTFGIVFPS